MKTGGRHKNIILIRIRSFVQSTITLALKAAKMNVENSSANFEISIWGSFPDKRHFGNDYLWHDVVPSLPKLGSVIKLDDTLFQVEGVCLDGLWIGEEENKDRYRVDVRPYQGEIAPIFTFSFQPL